MAATKRVARWATLACAAMAAVLVLVLAMIHVDSVNAVIAVQSSELQFTVDSAAELTRGIELATLQLFNVLAVRVPDYRGKAETELHTSTLGLTTVRPQGRLTMNAVQVDSGARVTVSSPLAGLPSLSITADKGPRTVTLGVLPKTIIITDSSSDTLKSDRQLTAILHAGELAALVLLADTTASLFASSIPIAAITLHRTQHDRVRPEETTLRAIQVDITGYDDKPGINAADVVKVGIQSNGSLRELRVTGKGIEANVGGLFSSITHNGQSVMPSYLEYFSKETHLRLEYAAAVFIFTCLTTALKWLRPPAKS